MLKEIQSSCLIEKKIEFHDGLNIVLGDSNATNSIGKSSFLMIIDFIFGGEAYLKEDDGIFENIGPHYFNYKFEFENKEYFFKKDIVSKGKEVIYKCDKNYNIKGMIEAKKYLKFLEENYKSPKDSSFRNMVGLFSRVWGKDNYNPKKVLEGYLKESELVGINRIFKIFNKYSIIEEKEKIKKDLTKEKIAMNQSSHFKIINKITKKTYEKNAKILENLNSNDDNFLISCLKNINMEKKEVDVYIKLLKDLRKKELEKFDLEVQKGKLETKGLKKNFLTKKEIDTICKFFQEIDANKIEKIEEFHRKITTFLSEEIKEEKNELIKKIEEKDEEILYMKLELKKFLNKIGISDANITKELLKSAFEVLKMEQDNENYLKTENLKKRIEGAEEDLKQLRYRISDEISGKINFKMKEINEKISEEQVAPELRIEDTKYTCKVKNNSGTGRGYENIIIFDLSILELTQLPLLIHDSFLFKNISITLMENILEKYFSENNKQIFIALDELGRYRNEIQNIILKSTVLKLSKDRSLFKIQWGNKKK